MVKRVEKQIIPDGVAVWTECDLCPKLCSNSASVCMEGEGPTTSPMMVVNGNPSSFDDEMNRPFMDGLGEYFRDSILVEAKVPESKIRFTHAVRCHTVKDKVPSVSEVKRCRRYLEAEIRLVKPKVIVAMGNVALASIMQSFYKGGAEEGTAKKQDSILSGIGKWRGKMVWLQEFGCWLMPTYHPSDCVTKWGQYSTYTVSLIVGDLKRAWSEAQMERPEFPLPISIYVTNSSKAKSVLLGMKDAKSFAFDIETGGIGRSKDKWIIGCSFSCSANIGYYIKWDAIESSSEVFSLFKELMTDTAYYKSMHNGAYEVRILTMAYGIKINRVKYFDTMIAAHLVDENFSKRLKDLAWVYTSFGGYDVFLEKYKQEYRIKEDYSKIPDDILSPYGAFDAIATWIIYNKLSPIMASEKVDGVFNKIVMPVRRVMSDAEINGMAVDTERALELDGLCTKAIESLEQAVYKCAGKEFNIGSPAQLQTVLYKDMGFVPLKETKNGYSADSDSIAYIATQKNSEIAKYLLDLSYVGTMKGTHISQALAYTWPEDGRVHTNYNLTGAVTGRASASKPSLQNVPADQLVRSLYIASPGNVLIDGDLKSAEMATIAAVSGESTFLKAFAEGLDIHSETYRKMYNLPSDYVCTKLERRQAKAINFGLVYGMSPVGLAESLGVTVEEATAFMNLYFKQLPNVARWMEEQKRLVKINGYVVSVFGRKRRLPMAFSDQRGEVSRAERQAMNSPIQSGAADYTYIGLIRLRQAILRDRMKGKIVHTVHDCVVVDTPEDESERMVAMVNTSFQTRVMAMPVKMIVEVEVHQRWGQNNESRMKDIFDLYGLKLTS